MSELSASNTAPPAASWIERVGRRVPDPILLFMGAYPLAFVVSVLLGGHTFESMGAGGQPVTHTIRAMHEAEHVRWIFDHALVQNWLAFGGGVLGVILVVMLAVGVAEHSGLFAALIKRVAARLSQRWLPLLLVFLGITSSIATDAGYLVLIPLAGLLYAGLGRNPLIGMAAAFAGVSAGFSANLLPATPIDVIVGMNARAFAEAQGVPFVSAAGEPLNPATMNYFFLAASTFVLAAVGAWVTRRYVEPRLDAQAWRAPPGLDAREFDLKPEERRGLRASAVGLLVALAMVAGLAFGPLQPFTNESGQRVVPFLNNVILLIALVFVVVGIAFGAASGRFRRAWDVAQAMVAQMNTLGYVLVLTFFSYNLLSLLAYSGLGTYVTYLGAQGLLALGLQHFPVLLIVGFVLTTALINLFIGGLTSKWMLLGPIFVPMLYQVNPAMTPDLVAAAYRVADSSTNIVTPMMTYAGVILAFMRKYRPELGFGDVLIMMFPYSVAFLLVWTCLLLVFFLGGLPLGF